MHQRRAIREAAKAALLGAVTVDDVTTYATAAEDRVYETRQIPHRKLKLPAIAVYTLQESVDADSGQTAPRWLKRNMQLLIEAIVTPGSNVDDTLDNISLQIERAMHADETLGGTCMKSLLSSTELDFFEEGEKEIGLAKITYDVTYETQAPDADDLTLDPFEGANINYSLSGEQATADQAEDIIDNEED